MAQSITFLIRDAQGNSLQGAQVSSSIGSAYSDGNGSAEIPFTTANVGNGYVFTITSPGYTTVASTQSIPLYNQTVAITLTLQAQKTATGFIISDGQNPVPGATVFLNGASVGTTDASGHVALYLNTGTNHIEVEATNFASFSTDVDPSASPPSILYIVPLTTGTSFLSLVISPPGTTYVLGTEAGTIGADGSIQTQNQYPPAAYSVTWTSGATTRTDPFTVVAAQTVYTFTPLPATDDGDGNTGIAFSDGSAAAASSSQPGSPTTGLTPVSTSNAPVTAAAQNAALEFTAPNSNYGRYFTPTQARLYIGNLFIEELAGVQFVLQGNKVPVYGYASSEFDALGTGKYLVTGQIMLHFVSEGYLYTALNNYQSKTQAAPSASNQQFANLLTAENTVRSSNLSQAQQTVQLASYKAQRQQLVASNPSVLAAYQRTQISSLAIQKGPNALYQNVVFDLDLKFEGGGRTISRKIHNCILTSNEKIIADNDSNLLDCYGFIGRRLV
jgi:hypothetical protein